MKTERLFIFIFFLIIFFIFCFWLFVFFKTEAKPIYTPLNVQIDFKNNWLLLAPVLFNFWLLSQLLAKNYLNRKKLLLIFILGFSSIIIINSLKQNAGMFYSLQDDNDYYQNALEVDDLKRFLLSFDQRIFFHRLHTRTHPPGPVIFHVLLNKISGQNLIFNGLTMIFLSTALFLIVYKISSFFKSPHKNLLLLLLFSSPGYLLYAATSMDAVFAILIALSIYYLLHLATEFSLKNIILAGLCCFMAFFFTYASVIIPLFSLFFILFEKFRNKKFIYSQLIIALIIVLIYGILYLLTGFQPVASFWAARNFNTMLMPDIFMTLKRYLFSTSANFIEYIIFLGPAIVVLLIINLIYIIKQKKSINLFYYLSFLLPMFLLNIAGIYKTGQYSGETGRIWLFLTPLIIGGIIINNKKVLEFAVFLSFFQTLIMQLVFNTYW